MYTNKMKNSLLLFCCLLSITLSSTSQARDLNGKYAVGSFLMNKRINNDSLRNSKVCDWGKTPFIFQADKIVRINPRVGKEVFGDSIFTYEVTSKNIIFRNANRLITVPYVNDNGIIRLSVNNRYFKRLDLVQISK